ncbi:GPI ethanolamine phosphate transferase 3-like isoform X1 [Procambarus clarkii]|uniref:GPI ethanolamine phosphate transferase 3-like isoform X1 n=1 Tax=Procambarus clarkii TaxID=6728 RepID=UPI0037444CA4
MADLKSLQVFILILCLSELMIIGLLIFSHGFLLTRQVILANSTCEDFKEEAAPTETKDDKVAKSIKGEKEECKMPATFKRAIVLLIDALRYDFAAYNHTLKDEDALPYQNQMPVFRNLLHSKPEQAHLAPFIADAPTTTMQRLKGLTTGSLPTFIDASHNFASEEISEDNIVDQLVSHGKRLTILGDDTWEGLFPGRFKRSFLYPSFNVMDLHTVDNGVLSHLEQEMARNDWDVLIGHFLGVDHCGHRYGPNHPEMAAKLKQMNDIIKKVADGTQNDTLLIIFGDHGMTKTGDHGGDSHDETEAALFLYSPALSIVSPESEHGRALPIAQVDLVPSLALALGVPIPYSNLGKVMENILVTQGQSNVEAEQRQVVALAQNVKQVSRYLKDYKALGNVFPHDLWQRIELLQNKMLLGFENLSLREQKSVYSQYLTLAKMMCEEVWAKFSVSEICSGLILMLNSLVLASVVSHCKFILKNKIPVVKRVLFLTVLVNGLFVLIPYSNISVLGCAASVLITLWMYFHREVLSTAHLKFSTSDICSLLLVLFLCLGSFSNSYVVVENYVVAFILLSCLIIQLIMPLFIKNKKRGFNVFSGKNFKLVLNSYSVLCVFILSVVFFSVRLSAWFWKCREEQTWCTPSQVHITMTGLPQESRNWRYFTSLFALTLLVWLPRRWLLMCGNMNGSRVGIILYNSIPVVCGVLIAAHWALQAAPTLQNSNLNKYVVFPSRITYALTLMYVAALYIVPLFIYEVPPSKNKTSIQSVMDNPSALIPQLCKTLVAKYNMGNKKSCNIPIVYGLATAVSAPLVAVLTVVWVVLAMVAGDGLTPAMVLLFVSAIACLLIQALTLWQTADKLSVIMKPSWSCTCVWFILSIHGFYSTGHHPTFPTLHWSAAFVGFAGEWRGTNLIPALLVGLNTFSSQILFGFALPLVVLAPLALGVIFPKLRGNRLESEDIKRGEFLLVDEPDQAEDALIFVGLSYTLLHAVKLFCSALAAFILRRHLMVWKIFAPHFIFEGVGFIVTIISVLTGIWFTQRVLRVLTSWSETLYHKIS